MDRLNDEAYDGAQNVSSDRTFEGRASVEARSPQTQRLQKKRSNAGARTAMSSQAEPSALPAMRGPGDVMGAEGTKGRKMSIRNAVRKMFGRRSREPEPEPQPSQFSPPRHGYHRSEQIGRATRPAIPERPLDEQEAAQRTFSAPIELLPPPNFQRTRSPYAVEFPHSARLKPLNLGDPFSAPGSQLRRRKTLPSILLAESEDGTTASTTNPSDAPPVPSVELTRETPTSDAGNVRTMRSEKRKSRSAGDLRQSTAEGQSPPQKRSEELRSWRQSFQGSVLRASGFLVPMIGDEPVEERDEERTPLAQTMEDPFISAGGPSTGSTPFRRGPGTSFTDVGSPSALGTDISRDLEDRVAKLEAGLRNFRGELAQMTADRNRRTVMIGGVPTRQRASSSGRTASMLADTLQLDLEPSQYRYDYTERQRPSTSPQPPQPPQPYQPPQLPQPRTPIEADPSVMGLDPPLRDRAADEPYRTPSPRGEASGTSGLNRGATSQAQPPQYTFKSLYEMLTDERAARRRLELQMRGLRDEIQNLNYQVSVQSNVQSQRSSYLASMDPMVGSSRLHALLQDTESSPPGTADSQQRPQIATRFTAEQQRIVSRFSGSESEAGGIAESEDLQTPYDAYLTPAEEHGTFDFGLDNRHEGEMF